MNKAELVDKIAEKTQTTKKQTDTILTALTEIISDIVSSGEKVKLVGFGSFEPRDGRRPVGDHRKAKVGTHPKTGKKMQIKAKKVPAFNAGKDFKAKVAR